MPRALHVSLAASQGRRILSSQDGSEPFGKFSTLLLFSTGYKSVDLIRSAVALLGCRLLQPLHGFIFIHRHSVTIAIAHAKIVLSRSVAVTSRSCDPLGSGCAALSDPVSELVSHSHLECRRIISIYCPST